MKKLNEILIAALAEKGLAKEAISAQICYYAKEWGGGRFKPVSYQNGILKIAVPSSSAASELQMEQEKLIDDLNGRIGKKVIRSIRIINGS